ncbi:MAG: hypothetical protein WCZ98_09815 [Sideroxydans sp.]
MMLLMIQLVIEICTLHCLLKYGSVRPSNSCWANMKIAIYIFSLLLSCNAFASPCDGVDFSISEKRKVQLAPYIAKQDNNNEKVEILKSYSFRGWHIFFVNRFVADEMYFFYSGEPSQSKYLSTWSGDTSDTNELEVKQYVISETKGIPSELAGCFAWRVTRGMDYERTTPHLSGTR